MTYLSLMLAIFLTFINLIFTLIAVVFLCDAWRSIKHKFWGK